MKILVPHDGSAISDKAFKKAIVFAKKLNYEIILLHIIDLELLKADSITKYIREKSELKKANAQLLTYLKLGSESMLKDKIRKAKKENVKVRFILGIGSTPEGIVNVANSENVDFIINDIPKTHQKELLLGYKMLLQSGINAVNRRLTNL